MKEKKEETNKARRAWKIWEWVALVLGGTLLAGMVIGALVWWNLDSSKTDLERRKLPDRGLSVMEINLNGVSLEEIDNGSKNAKYEGNDVVLYERDKTIEYNNVEIKGRGNTTWEQEKKPYQIKFKKNVDLLGLGKAKKWALLANALDMSYLRNHIALVFAEIVEVPYSYRGDFVELYVNGDYRGLYYLVKKIEIAKGSVDLRNNDGVLFEMDMLHKNEEEQCFESYLGECLVLKDVVGHEISEESKIADSFLTDLNMAEEALREEKYENVAEIFDLDSFAKYFLVNEFAVNPDAYSTSFYLYRNNEGKIAAGPVWDFDLAFASRMWDWDEEEDFFSPNKTMIRKDVVIGTDGKDGDPGTSKLMYYLMDMPEFQKKVEQVFQERAAGRKQEIVQMIRDKAENIYQAAKVDGEKWKMAGFEDELMAIINWIKARYDHLEEVYGGGNASFD